MKNQKKQLVILLILVTVLICGCVRISIKAHEKPVSATVSTEQTTETETASETEPVIDENKPMIAITFDDGPSANTERVLDIFKKNGAKATFFVLGNRIEGNEDIMKRMTDEGHNIGSHSWDHSDLSKLSKKDVKNQIVSTKKAIKNACGYNSKLLRPPYGAWNDNVKTVAKNQGISIINWNVDTLDWQTKKKKKIANLIIKEARDGCIILCHDLYDSTVDAIEIAIPKLIKEGYQIVTVTDLLESHDGKLEAGSVYYNRWQNPS